MVETVLNVLLWVALIFNMIVLGTVVVVELVGFIKTKRTEKTMKAIKESYKNADLIRHISELNQKLEELKCTFDFDREMNFIINCKNEDCFLDVRNRLRELEKGHE